MRLTVPAGFRISVLICMCVTVFAAARQATAQAPSNGLYVFCSSDPDGATIYFSDIFIANPDPSTSRMRGVSFTKTRTAFVDYLKQKYGFKSASNYPAGCLNAVNSAQGLAYAKDHKQKMEDQYRQAKKQIVETGWKNE